MSEVPKASTAVPARTAAAVAIEAVLMAPIVGIVVVIKNGR